MRRPFLTILSPWIFCLFFLIPATHAAPSAYIKSPLVFPNRLAGMVKKKARKVKTQSLNIDIQVSYATRGALASIYFYTMGANKLPDGIHSTAARQHFNGAVKAMIKYTGAIKQSETITTLKDASGGGIQFLQASFTLKKGTAKYITNVYLRIYKNHFLKILFSYQKRMGRRGKRQLQRFLRAFGKQL